MNEDDKYNSLVFDMTVVTGMSMYIKHYRLDLIIVLLFYVLPKQRTWGHIDK